LEMSRALPGALGLARFFALPAPRSCLAIFASAPAHRARPLFECTLVSTEILRLVFRSFFAPKLCHSLGQRSETDLPTEFIHPIRFFEHPGAQLAAFVPVELRAVALRSRLEESNLVFQKRSLRRRRVTGYDCGAQVHERLILGVAP